MFTQLKMVYSPQILVHRVELGKKIKHDIKIGNHAFKLFAAVYLQEGVYMSAARRYD
jgi:hypothetical protein